MERDPECPLYPHEDETPTAQQDDPLILLANGRVTLLKRNDLLCD